MESVKTALEIIVIFWISIKKFHRIQIWLTKSCWRWTARKLARKNWKLTFERSKFNNREVPDFPCIEINLKIKLKRYHTATWFTVNSLYVFLKVSWQARSPNSESPTIDKRLSIISSRFFSGIPRSLEYIRKVSFPVSCPSKASSWKYFEFYKIKRG